MIKDYKNGDRVIGCGYQSGHDITGLTGTIINDKWNPTTVQVCFDKSHFYMHNCNGRTLARRGWNCNLSVLNFLEDVKSVEFLKFVTKEFSGKRIKLSANGNVIQLRRSINDMLILSYHVEKDILNMINTSDKTEVSYIELFKTCIEDFKKSK